MSMESYREHNTDSYDCWCSPRFFQPCDECGPDIQSPEHCGGLTVIPGSVTCWKCGANEFDGLIEITRDEADVDEDGLIVVHNEPAAV